MERLFDSLVLLQGRLKEAGIPSAVIGGVALSVWGEPRVTRDVDLKVLLGREEASRLLEVIADGYIPLSDDPLRTLTRLGFLFVEDLSGTRLDLLLSDTDFDVQVIRRAQPVELAAGSAVYVCTSEDLIIYKMLSTRPRDYEDVVSIVRRQGDGLDDKYVLDWLRRFEQALDDSTLVAEYCRLRGLG